MKLQNLIYILSGIVCIGLLPTAQAVVPPPDGGYPGFNTAEGTNALQSLTTGSANTAIGWYSLFSNTEGSFNTATGAGALLFSTSEQNTAFGAAALLFNRFGIGNTAVGAAALLSNTGGSVDTPNGGPGSGNTAVGVSALSSNIGGAFNTAVGANALSSNTGGLFNTAIGANALANSLGLGNIALGSEAGSNVTNANDVIAIGIAGANVDNSCFIGNIYSNVQPIVGTDPDSVTINSNGRLGRGNVSSRRYKHDIKPIDKASEALFALKPVSFRYNKEYDATQTLAFGLIAEEVAEVAPDLVGRNPDGQPESVRYEQVNAMLLNEFLKGHQRMQEQDKRIEELTSQLKEQAAQIQRVSDELEMSKPAPRMVVQNQ